MDLLFTIYACGSFYSVFPENKLLLLISYTYFMHMVCRSEGWVREKMFEVFSVKLQSHHSTILKNFFPSFQSSPKYIYLPTYKFSNGQKF